MPSTAFIQPLVIVKHCTEGTHEESAWLAWWSRQADSVALLWRTLRRHAIMPMSVPSTVPFSLQRSLESRLRARHISLVEDADER